MTKAIQLLTREDQTAGSRESRTTALGEVAGLHACIETHRVGQLGLELEDVPYVGSLEFWFTSGDAARTFAADGPVQRQLWQAEATSDPLLLTTARVVLGDADTEPVAEGLKGIFVFRRKPDMPIPAFQQHWLETHGPIAARTPHTSRYVQCHVLAESYAEYPPPYDGVTELYWDSLEDAAAAMQSDSMTVEQSADARNFVDGTSIKMFIVTSDRLI